MCALAQVHRVCVGALSQVDRVFVSALAQVNRASRVCVGARGPEAIREMHKDMSASSDVGMSVLTNNLIFKLACSGDCMWWQFLGAAAGSPYMFSFHDFVVWLHVTEIYIRIYIKKKHHHHHHTVQVAEQVLICMCAH